MHPPRITVCSSRIHENLVHDEFTLVLIALLHSTVQYCTPYPDNPNGWNKAGEHPFSSHLSTTGQLESHGRCITSSIDHWLRGEATEASLGGYSIKHAALLFDTHVPQDAFLKINARYCHGEWSLPRLP